MDAPSRSEIALFVLTIMGAAIGGAAVAVPAYWGTSREMDVKMVEIAVGILSQEPKENIAPAREWAVDVISQYAEVKPTEAVRSALVNYRAVNYGSTYVDTSFFDTYTPSLRPSPPSPEPLPN